MRWPWSKREPDPEDTAADEIAELMVEHQDTLKRAGRLLSERSARIMDDYARADQERRR